MTSQNYQQTYNLYFLSDSKISDTNIPYRIFKLIKVNNPNTFCEFISLNLFNKEIIRLIKNNLFLIKHHKTIIIHSHHPKSLIINILLKILLSKVFRRKIISCHTFHYEKTRFSFIKLIPFALSKYFIDIYFSVSNEVRKQWSNYLKKQIYLSYIGITESESKIIKRLSIQKKVEDYKKSHSKIINITWVGRLEEIKRPLFFLESLNYFKSNKEFSIQVNFIGDGKLRDLVQKKIKNLNKRFEYLNLNINLNYLGFLERNKIYKIISITNIYICSSASESFCVSALEFITNPYCRIILPNIKTLKNIYNCRRTKFFNPNDKYDLFSKLNKTIDESIYNKSDLLNDNYPLFFNELKLDNLAKNYQDIYLSYLQTI